MEEYILVKKKLDILRKKGKIYYSDTNSIVTDAELHSDMVSANELGKLKKEHFITEGIFICGKLYCFTHESHQLHIKAKGVYSNRLKHKDFLDLLLSSALLNHVMYLATFASVDLTLTLNFLFFMSPEQCRSPDQLK